MLGEENCDWVTLSEKNYKRMLDLWHTPGREREPAYFGWRSTDIPLYEPSTLELKTVVHTLSASGRRSSSSRPSSRSPWSSVKGSGSRVREIALAVLHPGER